MTDFMTVTRRAPRRGATLIEFAAVVPVLMLLTLGIMEFGWYARTQLTLANATREGARAASIGKTQTEIKTRVKNAAKPVVVADNEITLEYSTDSGANYVNFPGDNTLKSPPQNDVPPGNLLRVTVNVANPRLVNLPITPARLNVRVSMVRERS